MLLAVFQFTDYKSTMQIYTYAFVWIVYRWNVQYSSFLCEYSFWRPFCQTSSWICEPVYCLLHICSLHFLPFQAYCYCLALIFCPFPSNPPLFLRLSLSLIQWKCKLKTCRRYTCIWYVYFKLLIYMQIWMDLDNHTFIYWFIGSCIDCRYLFCCDEWGDCVHCGK